MIRDTRPLPGTRIDPRYPDSYGRSLAESEFHNGAIILLREGLEAFFAPRADVYISSQIDMYYRQGDRTIREDPDVLVAMGAAGKHKRRAYRVWQESVAPRAIFAIASERTWQRDLTQRRALYAEIGIKEYFVFDPECRFVAPRLQGFSSNDGKSLPIKPRRDGSLVSKALGLILRPEGETLRVVDSKTGWVPTSAERLAQLAAEVERLKTRIAELES
jgi:Uma2 family endonuclease